MTAASSEVTVRVAGGQDRVVPLAADATYADLLEAVDRSPHEAAALVDGRPMPADATVDATDVTVLQLVQGG